MSEEAPKQDDGYVAKPVKQKNWRIVAALVMLVVVVAIVKNWNETPADTHAADLQRWLRKKLTGADPDLIHVSADGADVLVVDIPECSKTFLTIEILPVAAELSKDGVRLLRCANGLGEVSLP